MNEVKNRDFREIQVSSSLLVVIFLAVLALGVFIFLLGVSVGKRQGKISGESQVVAQAIREETPPSTVQGGPETSALKTDPQASQPAEDLTQSPASRETAPPQVKSSVTQPKTKNPSVSTQGPASGQGLWYVQVGAFLQKDQALSLADKYRAQGYTAVVTDPKPNDTRSWYRVRLGGFANRARAEDLLSGLNAAAGSKTDFRVVRD